MIVPRFSTGHLANGGVTALDTSIKRTCRFPGCTSTTPQDSPARQLCDAHERSDEGRAWKKERVRASHKRSMARAKLRKMAAAPPWDVEATGADNVSNT